MFNEAAIAIAQRFRFPPEMRNCRGVRAVLRFRATANAQGVVSAFVEGAGAEPPLRADTAQALRERNLRAHCQIQDGAVNKSEFGLALERLYPTRARDRGRTGSVVVQFSIAPDGSVSSPVVLEELPPRWDFGPAALEAVMVTRYPPRARSCERAVTTIWFLVE